MHRVARIAVHKYIHICLTDFAAIVAIQQLAFASYEKAVRRVNNAQSPSAHQGNAQSVSIELQADQGKKSGLPNHLTYHSVVQVERNSSRVFRQATPVLRCDLYLAAGRSVCIEYATIFQIIVETLDRSVEGVNAC